MSEESRTKRRERRRKRRRILLEMLGGQCVICGISEELTFDHLDRSTKSFELSGRGLDGSWERILKELDKTQILCDNCHKEKTRLEDRLNASI